MAEAEVTLVTIIDKLSSYNLYVAGANFGLNSIICSAILWSSGKGKGIGSTQQVTQRSFTHPPSVFLLISRIEQIIDQVS